MARPRKPLRHHRSQHPLAARSISGGGRSRQHRWHSPDTLHDVGALTGTASRKAPGLRTIVGEHRLTAEADGLASRDIAAPVPYRA